MPEDKVLTTKEVAEYIKLNEKTVLKLAQYGELPGVKMGNQWRFHLTSIDQYLQKQLMDSSDEDLDIVIKTKNRPLPLSRLVDHRLIDTNITARNKKQVLSQLAKIAHSAWITPSYESLFVALEERENMLSTGLGQGVAVPHPRTPHQSLFQEAHIIIARSPGRVDFDAPDGQKVGLFFLPCAPSEYVHIRLMAKIAKLLHMPGAMQQLKEAARKEDVMKVLLAYDQTQMIPPKPEDVQP
ncbi:MAG: PTS sugar transporter subunit IIA [Candidatus Omnitrophica bacterium]|nr:PTS sugar transporter subunit IIA [Candidatus Omnitrophota bacterium]